MLFETNIPLIATTDGLLIPAPKVYATNKIKPKRKPKNNLPKHIIDKKNEVIFRKVLFIHHPLFKSAEAQMMVIQLGFHSFNITHLVEQVFAYVGGYAFIDGPGSDFNDIEDSDSKTLTVNKTSGKAELNGVGNKIGTIRLIIYNPLIQDVHFMYMPYADWMDMAVKCHGKHKGDLRLLMSYSFAGDHYNQFEKFRVKDFITCATRMDMIQYPGMVSDQLVLF
jgi:hypothetical protein